MDEGFIEEIIGFFVFLSRQIYLILSIIIKILIKILIIILILYISFYGLPSYVLNNYVDNLPKNSNVFDENTNLDFYIYLSNNKLKPNFHNSDQLIWSIKNLNYTYKFGYYENNEHKKLLKFKDRSYIFPFDFTTLINTDKYNISDDTLYLHIFIVKNNYLPYFDDNKLYSKNETFHKIKSLNTSDWLSNYTISLLDHKQNANALTCNKSINKLIEYNVETGYYYPILFIDNYSNNYLDKENQSQVNKKELLLNLNLNHVSLCQFINYLCDKVTKYDQYYRICIEEMSELSRNFYIFLLDLMTGSVLSFFFILFIFPFIIILPIGYYLDFLPIIFLRNRPKISTEVNDLSISMIIFECLKSLIFLLYEANRLSSFYCLSEKPFNKYLNIQPIIIFFWAFIFISSLIKIKYRTNVKSIIDYDKLVCYNLFKILIPLFIAYSYYSFNSYYHKNMYYLIVNTLYGFFLNFGFLIYISQIYINHKLKSTPHYFFNGGFAEFFIFKTFSILLEDIIDFQTNFKWREPYKLIYLREEIIAIYFAYQLKLYECDLFM